jgi:hypothetical protein
MGRFERKRPLGIFLKNGRVILRWIRKKLNGLMWTMYMWAWIEAIGGLLFK